MLLVSRSSHSAVACLLSNPLSAPCSFSDARPGPSLVSSLHQYRLDAPNDDEEYDVQFDDELAPKISFKKSIGSVSVSNYKFVRCPMPSVFR
ncbi:hypothetical protein Ahy_B06g081328 [Arachis hypogaea]|uniref:Uncharacterized protein n=1 Tax=Arachis hypogaea TaxID=3818 RepID=A0A444YL05_ARAHY|nr:hypothetical protein Ahy_B06g081328 [Arachis hypogaea]